MEIEVWGERGNGEGQDVEIICSLKYSNSLFPLVSLWQFGTPNWI